MTEQKYKPRELTLRIYEKDQIKPDLRGDFVLIVPDKGDITDCLRSNEFDMAFEDKGIDDDFHPEAKEFILYRGIDYYFAEGIVSSQKSLTQTNPPLSRLEAQLNRMILI